MSAPKKKVVLSPDARADFTDILLYGKRVWGDERRDRYEAALQRAIDGLADFPESGARRDRFFPGCRIRPVEQHILYYRIDDDAIEVVRILHKRADAARHLPTQPR